MKSRIKPILGAILAACAGAVSIAQQQPVVSVSITDVAVLGDGSDEVAFVGITNSGSGYQVAPKVTISPDPADPNAAIIVAAKATATIGLEGSLTSLTITNPGANYFLPPVITIDPPTGVSAPGVPGVNAAASAYLGTHFAQPVQNESFGHAGYTIGMTALAVGTFPAGGYQYEFFVNGISIGRPATPPPPGTPATIAWTPPQPGAYFLTVTASDGANSAISLPVRYFATGTAITSPTPNTIVPQGSSVVIQATSMPQPLTGTGGGNGYTSAPSVTILDTGGGSGAKATATVAGGKITSFTVTNPGSGYKNIPLVVLSGGGGTGANAVATIDASTGTVTGVSLTGSDAFVGTISFFADPTVNSDGTLNPGTLIGLIGSDDTAPYSVIYTPTASPITHVILAVAKDNKGNVIQAYNGQNVIGITMVPPIGTPPVVTINSPANGSVLPVPSDTSGVIPIAVSSGSSGGLVTKVELYVDGALLGTDTTFPYSFDWKPTLVGDYQLIALAYDDKSNVVASTAITAKIRAQPTVTILAPVTGATVGVGVPVTLTAAASDSNVIGGGIANVQFYVNGDFVGSGTASGGNQYSIVWAPTTAGSASITALASNNVGLTAQSAAVTLTVSKGGGGGPTNVNPSVSLVSPAGAFSTTAGLPVTLIASATDSDGTIAQVRFLANGIVIGAPITTAPYTTTWTPTTGGTYSIVAEATDNAGGTTTSTPEPVIVAPNILPTVAITSPANGATVRVNSNIVVKATATDVDGTIATVQFYANGVSLGEPLTAYPYQVQWKPTSEGLYRLSAVTTDSEGATTISSTVLVTVSANAGDAISTGTYLGTGESGNFAIVAATGRLATFIAYSTTPGVKKTYFYPDVSVDVSGGFSKVDDSGATLVSGAVGDTGTSGTFDSGRLTFIGIDTRLFPASIQVASGYYTGSISGRASSTIAAIVGSDGSIMLYAADGTFTDAGSGKVDANGAFNVASVQGNRFTGTVGLTTGALTGHLTGSSGGDFSASASPLGGMAEAKVAGDAREVASNLTAPNHNVYDQVLLTGASASITADPGQITRISYVDLSNDIVQVEFSGAGRLTLSLDDASGPAPAVDYNQPDVSYMKGHANIIITGANETTNVSVFSVGPVTAVNQALFKSGVSYDGVADIGYLAIFSANGKFGGVRTANADYIAAQGMTGICAPDVQFVGPVYVGDINASDSANAVLLLGSANDVRVTGGDLWQQNGGALQISGVSQLQFVDGVTSQGVTLSAQQDRSRIEQNGIDVTAQVVVVAP
ncbi:MAG TPA: Ig-like domain-containing protein [Opitutus sp.]|nr:Ig-like domain-containing protein [Opitutus sp.]